MTSLLPVINAGKYFTNNSDDKQLVAKPPLIPESLSWQLAGWPSNIIHRATTQIGSSAFPGLAGASREPYHEGVELRGASLQLWSALSDAQLHRTGFAVRVRGVHLAHNPVRTQKTHENTVVKK